MKKLAIAAIVAGFAISPAFATSLEDACVAYAEANTGDDSGCSCLAGKADDAMTEELLAVETEADLDAVSQSTKEAIASCWPDA